MVNRFQNVAKPRHSYSVITLSLVLFLLGIIGLVAYQANSVLRDLKENVNVIIEIKDSVSMSEIKKLEEFIKTKNYIKPQSVVFIDKDAGAQFLKEDFGEDIILLGLENPLHHIFSLNVLADYMQADSLETIRKELTSEREILDVYYQKDAIASISQNLNRIIYTILGVSVILFLTVFLIIHNNVKLSLYSNRLMIKKMQMVGASRKFIRRPYIYRSLGHGILSAIIAGLLIVLLAFWINKQLPELNLLNNALDFAVLFIGILILGIGINLTSTYFIVNKYLRLSINDLY